MVSGMWQQQGTSVIFSALIGSAILLAIILYMTTRTARALKFSTADEIAAVFCASKNHRRRCTDGRTDLRRQPWIGLILLPIMIYHPLQLIVCSVMAESYASRNRQEKEEQSQAAVPAN